MGRWVGGWVGYVGRLRRSRWVDGWMDGWMGWFGRWVDDGGVGGWVGKQMDGWRN